jgi:hypothetical protein
VWAEAEVLNGLTGVLWTSEEQGVAACWGAEGELIEGENLTTGGQDAGTGGGGEAEGSDAQLWDSQKTVVIGDGTDNDNSLVVGLLRDVRDNSGKGDWWSVDLGHEQTTQNNLVEGRISPA